MSKQVGEVLYVTEQLPCEIIDVKGASIIYVQQELLEGFKEMNNDKADKLKPYNYFLFRVRKPEWAEDYVEPDKPSDDSWKEGFVFISQEDASTYLNNSKYKFQTIRLDLSNRNDYITDLCGVCLRDDNYDPEGWMNYWAGTYACLDDSWDETYSGYGAVIWDNQKLVIESEFTHIQGNVYEYTFSTPVYISEFESNFIDWDYIGYKFIEDDVEIPEGGEAPDEPVNPDGGEVYVNRLKSDGYSHLQLHIDNYTPSTEDNAPAPTFTLYDNEGGVGGFTSILALFKEQASSIPYNNSKIFTNFDLDNVDTDAQKVDKETNSPEDITWVYASLDANNSNKLNIYKNSEVAAAGATEYAAMSFELVDGNKVIYTILDRDFTQPKYMNFYIEFYY